MKRKELIIEALKNPLILELIDKKALTKKQLVKFILLETTDDMSEDEDPDGEPPEDETTGDLQELVKDEIQQNIKEYRDVQKRVLLIFQAISFSIPHINRLFERLEFAKETLKKDTANPEQSDGMERLQEQEENEEQEAEITDRDKIVENIDKIIFKYKKSMEVYKEILKNKENLSKDFSQKMRPKCAARITSGDNTVGKLIPKVSGENATECTDENVTKALNDDPEMKGASFSASSFIAYGLVPTDDPDWEVKTKLVKAFNLKELKTLEQFEKADPDYGKHAFHLSKIKSVYNMLDGLIGKLKGGKITYKETKIDAELKSMVLPPDRPPVKIPMPDGKTQTFNSGDESMSAVDYLKALRKNIKSGLPIEGYLGKPSVPKKIDEAKKDAFTDNPLFSADDATSAAKIEDKYNDLKQISNEIDSVLVDLIKTRESEGVTANAYFNFFKKFKNLKKKADKQEDLYNALVKEINLIPANTYIRFDQSTVSKLEDSPKVIIRSPGVAAVTVNFMYKGVPGPEIKNWFQLYKRIPNIIDSMDNQKSLESQYTELGNIDTDGPSGLKIIGAIDNILTVLQLAGIATGNPLLAGGASIADKVTDVVEACLYARDGDYAQATVALSGLFPIPIAKIINKIPGGKPMFDWMVKKLGKTIGQKLSKEAVKMVIEKALRKGVQKTAEKTDDLAKDPDAIKKQAEKILNKLKPKEEEEPKKPPEPRTTPETDPYLTESILNHKLKPIIEQMLREKYG